MAHKTDLIMCIDSFAVSNDLHIIVNSDKKSIMPSIKMSSIRWLIKKHIHDVYEFS